MCYVQVYLDLLEVIVQNSLNFESDAVLPFDIPMAKSRTVLDRDGRLDEVDRECEFLDSYINHYPKMFSGEFKRARDKRK